MINSLEVDVSIVTYNPRIDHLRELLVQLVNQEGIQTASLNLSVYDNSGCDSVFACIKEAIADFHDRFSTQSCVQGEKNIGFGQGNNKAIALGKAPYVLVLNQDILLEPGSLAAALDFASTDAEGGMWEFRQIPYEHPKTYNPVTLETSWSSGATFLVSRDVYEHVGGFDKDIFMYGEDVDLSWKIRSMGKVVRYIPWAAARHDTYEFAEQVKPLQALEGTYSNLCLRARYGSWKDILIGMLQWTAELGAPSDFAGRRKGLLRIGGRYVISFFRFRRSGNAMRKSLRVANFHGWDYALHRDGAFFPFRQRQKWDQLPLVSVLIRTCGRPDFLREALLTATRQTYPHVQVIVVEDGKPFSQAMISKDFPDCDIKYHALGSQQGRSVAGNKALELSDGDWLCFLDDDDQFFLDHIEVLLQSALDAKVAAAYAWAWEVTTDVQSLEPLRYTELHEAGIHKRVFDRLRLWRQNYLPIQTVLFKRELFEQQGGFMEDMEQLEDWNLWVRYSLNNDFLSVDKTTSRYRVPAHVQHSQDRQQQLDEAYEDALARYSDLEFVSSPTAVVRLIENFERTELVLPVYRSSVRRIVMNSKIGPFAVRIYRIFKRRFKRAK